MTTEEMFDKLRSCIAFGSNTSPYVLTDAEEFELYDFIAKLEEAESQDPLAHDPSFSPDCGGDPDFCPTRGCSVCD